VQDNNQCTSHTHTINRKPPSLSTHLWILSNVLCKGGQSNHDWTEVTTNLTRYVMARSFQKMNHRFNNKYLSLPFFRSLLNVNAVPIMSQQTLEKERDQMEVDSDRRFLEDFINISPLENHDFIDVKIPNILHLAINLSSDDNSLELYTNKTSTEFHQLLLDILVKFRGALQKVTSYDNANAKKDTTGEDPAREDTFNKNIHNIHVYGYALLRLSRGHAFRLHLENIAKLLEDPFHSGEEKEDSDEEEEDSDEEEEDSIEDFDEELEAIQPTFPRTGGLPKSYTAWLRLMVSHFDAIEIVVRFLQKLQCDTISVDILVAPRTDNTLLPWQELFSGSYLPNMDSGRNTTGIPSQDDIRVFLEQGISRAEAVNHDFELAKMACIQWSPAQNPQHSQATTTLGLFPVNSNIRPQVNDILAKINEWQLIPHVAPKREKAAVSRIILSMMRHLKTDLQHQKDGLFFFSKLEDMKLPEWPMGTSANQLSFHEISQL
jgi:hypothetical protein